MMVNRNACPYCHYTVGHADTCELILGAKALTDTEAATGPVPYVSDATLDAVAAAIAPRPAPVAASIVERIAPQQMEATLQARATLDKLAAGEGVKFDMDKIRHELLPTDVLDEVGRVLTFGAAKYGDRNWERGMAWNRVIGAALRHLFAVMRGEDRDEETGLLHSAHAICCMMFLCGYQIRKIGTDDRKPL